jgi:hypothetical protein
MSASNPAPPPQATAPPKRNPVEQMIVRGLIGLLLVLVAVEAYPWYSHRQALQTLQKRVAEVEKDPNSKPLREAEVKAAVGGKKPTSTEELKGRISNGAQRLEIYNWFTLNPFSERRLFVYYGHLGPNETEGAEVLEVQPDQEIAPPAQPSAEDLKANEENAARNPPMGMPGMGGPPGGGPGPGGPGGRPGGGRGGPPAHDPGAGDAKPDSDKSADDKDTDDKPKDEDKDQ